MSFVLNPTALKTPRMPGMNIRDFWTGIDQDRNLFVYYVSAQNFNTYIMTENFVGYLFKNSNGYFRMIFNDVNGYVYWTNNGENLLYSNSWGWVLTTCGPGKEPVEYYDSSRKSYMGDRFWSGSLPDTRDGAVTVFQPRGSIRNDGSTRTLEFWMPRRVSKTQFGIYTPANTAVSGQRIMGLPRFIDNEGSVYIRSFSRVDGAYTYGAIHRAGNKWLIGTEGSESGWFEGEEPNTQKAVVFRFCKNEDSDLERSDLSISLKDFIQGDERFTTYLGEFAIWR